MMSEGRAFFSGAMMQRAGLQRRYAIRRPYCAACKEAPLHFKVTPQQLAQLGAVSIPERKAFFVSTVLRHEMPRPHFYNLICETDALRVLYLCFMITSHHTGDKGYSYKTFKDLLEVLVKEQKTTGLNQSAEYIEFTRVNLHRMNRLDKTISLTDELRTVLDGISDKLYWFVLTEGWCGDAAQNVPLMQKVAAYCDKIVLRLLIRDEHPEVMNNYLTNGARAIPKLICVDEDLNEKFVWGPRPAALQEQVVELLKRGVSKEEKGLFTQGWYNKDQTVTLQGELAALLRGVTG